MPVDDEAHWLPAKDPGDSEGLDGDPDRSATTGEAIAP
jgi:hypothetical protein